MKRLTISLALFHDALYQVLDNRVFRILMVLTIALISIPWLIGFREDEVVLAWGWRTYFYQDVLESMGWMLGGLPGTDQERLIGQLQNLIVNKLAGTFGIFFCLAATSFFVPRLLEKGAADPLFSKPVSRFALLISRYVAGLLFIAGLSAFLIGGIHLGLLVNSHYSDPTFLWTIPILVYKFGLLFSFTVLVGVWTRSATAALLLSFVFLAVTAGVHLGWRTYRWSAEFQIFEPIKEMSELHEDPSLDEVKNDVKGIARVGLTTLSVLHHGLPKISDANALAALARTQLESTPFEQEFAFEMDQREILAALRPDGALELQLGKELQILEPGSEGTYVGSFSGSEIEIHLGGPSEPVVQISGERVDLIDPSQAREEFMTPEDWYSSKFDWNAEWRYSAWYSLGSSLAFVGTMLGLAWLRLRRINF